MNDPVNPYRTPAGDEPDARFDAALRAAFGPASTAAPADRCGVLEGLRRSSGVASRVLLRDESDAPSPVVGPGPGEERCAGGRQGRYDVLGEIARGGMGIVLKGRDPDLGRDVAVKVLLPGHAGNPAMIRRFIEEAQVGGQLQHPGILPVYELGLDAELRPYFTMRLVKGRTLAVMLEERPEPDVDHGRFLSLFEQVCQTVAYAHARGVIHRDLKPANIMIGAFGEVQVVDWGLAKVLRQGAQSEVVSGDEAPAEEPWVTTIRTTGQAEPSQAGAVIGTPSYMSPEQARGEIEGLDEQADVFALGAILCEILTGQPPHVGSRSQILALTTGVAFAVIFERERRSRAEHSITEVAALYQKADWFRDLARHFPPDQLDPWEGAFAQVRRTAEIVGAGAIDKETRDRFARLLDELRNEERRVRERRASPKKSVSDSPTPSRQNQE
jgi:serine/threonine protein kinase